MIWSTDRTSAADAAKWLGPHRAAAYVERRWLRNCADAVLHRYELSPEGFENLSDAGMWVSRSPVTPLNCVTLSALPATFAPRGVDLRVVDSLVPLRGLWATSLHASGIRLRNATGWS